MNLIPRLTAAPLQRQTLLLPGGSSVFLEIYFRPSQSGWYVNRLTWKLFVVGTLRITNNVNILRPWKNILPFGLACFTADNREPTQAQDFSSGAAQLYLLTPAEVAQYETYLSLKKAQ